MTGKTNVLLIGISGPSCSGKTTLARLLRDIWPSTFILHEDDFYWTDNKIPLKNGVQDWDCLESIDLKSFCTSLKYIKEHGALPSNLLSKEDQNSVGQSSVNEEVVRTWTRKIADQFPDGTGIRIAICDGFLLYSEHMKECWELLEIRLLLRADYATVKKRREARSGYVTLEGFWEDPPGYVDKIVWPNYVEDHAFLFQNRKVEGDVDESVATAMKLNIMSKEHQNDMTKCLDWACRLIQSAVDDRLGEP